MSGRRRHDLAAVGVVVGIRASSMAFVSNNRLTATRISCSLLIRGQEKPSLKSLAAEPAP
jgi:hypothetical protein